ncbi:hypothetical protein [Desemzia sp. FAM 23989]|uniref:hypothetical protein n=1 Tax=Desemzia sp. FAM 23989 TaxID=3259523 RepID=UPI00388563AF
MIKDFKINFEAVKKSNKICIARKKEILITVLYQIESLFSEEIEYTNNEKQEAKIIYDEIKNYLLNY